MANAPPLLQSWPWRRCRRGAGRAAAVPHDPQAPGDPLPVFAPGPAQALCHQGRGQPVRRPCRGRQMRRCACRPVSRRRCSRPDLVGPAQSAGPAQWRCAGRRILCRKDHAAARQQWRRQGRQDRDLRRRLQRPFGLACHDGALYVGDVHGIWKLAYKPGALTAGARTRCHQGRRARRLGRSLDAQHRLRPQGRPLPRRGQHARMSASIRRPMPPSAFVKPDGTLTPFATGLRNPVGHAFLSGYGRSLCRRQ